MDYKNLLNNKKSIWQSIDENQHKEIFAYGEKYKDFLDKGKTERESCDYIVEKAKENGFMALEEAIKTEIKPGQKIYLNNKNKSVVLYVMGKDLEEGMNIVGAHIDVPRLDLKQNPLYQDSELAMFKTHYYGGVRKYQWPTIQLAIHGVIYNQKGEKITINIGEKEDDPVFFINDLLPHLGAKQNTKPLGEAIEGEQLNVVVGHSSYGIEEDEAKDNPIKKLILKHLNEEYGIVEEDFQIAELEVVPAAKARDVGFDRSMIAGHGHDDRVCGFAALDAILKIESPEKTAVALLVDKEEIGSVGNASMAAHYFEDSVAEIFNANGDYSEISVRRALRNSRVLSADVTVAVDPNHKDVTEELNTAKLGYGVAMAKYTGVRGKGGSNDANAEFLQEVRKTFSDNNIIWQTGELGKVDQGGGGTIAFILAEYGAEVVDMGTPMLSMHAPVELVSKADAYMTMKAYEAFLK